MRPQQNRRMRGRGNNSGGNNNNNNNNGNNNSNRKGPNPLTRSYESNGPDVKIRGSAQQIAEKYTTLARDAQSVGDRVIAENYLQHAEHYNRIIMAALAQMPAQQQQVRDSRDDDDLDDEGDEGFVQAAAPEPAPRQQHQRGNNGTGPQPVIEGTPAEVALKHGTIGEAPVAPAPVVEIAEAPVEVAAEAVAEEQQAEPAAEAAPRRPRRPRRPRVKAEDAAAGEEQAVVAGEEPVTEAAQ